MPKYENEIIVIQLPQSEDLNDTNESAIVTRLNGLIRLIMEEQNRTKTLKRGEQLLALESAGLLTSEIAGIVGQKSKDVSSTMRNAKKERDSQNNSHTFILVLQHCHSSPG